MKPRQVLIFILGVFALIGLAWLVFPADGLAIGNYNLRFASYQRMQQDAAMTKVDVDSVLTGLEKSFQMEKDELLSLPGDDISFFDSFFRDLDNAAAQGRLVRIVHYGDSQIELDRISQDLRENLQGRFGGNGTGMFPALSNVPSASISRSAGGGFAHYTMYGDSTTVRAGHSRYGMLAQVVQLSGGGTVTLRSTRNKTARERCRKFSSVSVLYGRAGANFSVQAVSDTLKPEPLVETSDNATLISWNFGREVEKATIKFKGNAEIYGISADDESGIAVDNIPLRGCSGTIFTRISKDLMRDCMALSDIRLIILQFGGNFMPVARNSQVIENYCRQIESQLRYFHEVAPQAKILFIGPSDMGKSVNGRIVTWPRLPEVVDSLKATALNNDAAYWDLYRMMGGENSMVQWVKHSPPYAGADYIHFTPAGAGKVGEALSNSILTYYNYYKIRTGGK